MAMYSYVFWGSPNIHGQLHACFAVGLLEDLEPKGECWEGDSVTGLLLHRLQLREGGVVNQLQQMTIQGHLSGKEREREQPGIADSILSSCLLKINESYKNQ